MTDFTYCLGKMFLLYFTANWDNDTFARAQKLKANLITARNNHSVTEKEYRALYPLVNHLIGEMRNVLKKTGQL